MREVVLADKVMMKTEKQRECPCGGGRFYADCCGRLHAGEVAPTAEALMRSRYSAYVLGRMDYVADTWHPSTRPSDLHNDSSTRWLGLKVLAQQQHTEDLAEVEFVARYRQGGGRAVRMHERSQFVRENGRWFYRDGTFIGD